MKNFKFYMKSFQINKVYFITATFLISCFIIACASNKVSNNNTINKLGVEYYRDSQQKWLASLKEGMSLEDALKQVLPYQNYFFQRKENAHLFQYSEGIYPETRMLFGLFFEDGKLTSLLLDQAVNDLSNCRRDLPKYNFTDLWHTKDFEKTISWIREQNRLGGKYDDVSTEYRPDNSDGSGNVTEGIITALFFAPFAPAVLMAMPFIPEDKSDYYKNPEHLHELSRQIELGVATGKDLIRVLGRPSYKSETKGTWVWHGSGSIIVSFVGGTVHWTESIPQHWSNPINNKTTPKANNCVPSN